MTIGTKPISEVEFDIFCRHQTVPILMALQYLFVYRKDIVREICKLIENDLIKNKDKLKGRNGLSLWEILVLAACRLGCNLDYDHLSDLGATFWCLGFLNCF